MMNRVVVVGVKMQDCGTSWLGHDSMGMYVASQHTIMFARKTLDTLLFPIVQVLSCKPLQFC